MMFDWRDSCSGFWKSGGCPWWILHWVFQQLNGMLERDSGMQSDTTLLQKLSWGSLLVI